VAASGPVRARCLVPRLQEALADTPAVLITGPRQSGKTTICLSLAGSERRRFLTMDDGLTLAAAGADPDEFLSTLRGPVVIDEVQRVPDLLLALKRTIDSNREPGRFLLAGSTSVLSLSRAAESLAGRMEVHQLWTFSQDELEHRCGGFVDEVFATSPPGGKGPAVSRQALVERVCRGGYPEVQGRLSTERRQAWFTSYVTAVVQRDIRDLAHIEGITALPRLLSTLAARPASILNIADLGRALGLSYSTLQRYLSLLEAVGLIRLIPAWTLAGGHTRLMKAPRLMITDTGLAAHLAGADVDTFRQDPASFGPLLENFVAMELERQCSWSTNRARLSHFRSYAGREVDLVLERPNGNITGIEVKAGTVGERDFAGLKTLADLSGRRFKRGIVLHTGSDVQPFGKHLWAVPIAALWGQDS
jgi:uncharacterized protein